MLPPQGFLSLEGEGNPVPLLVSRQVLPFIQLSACASGLAFVGSWLVGASGLGRTVHGERGTHSGWGAPQHPP